MAQSATAHWTGARRPNGQPVTTFEVRSASGHTAIADEPPAFGDDTGMRPTEMLLGALAACTGVNAVLLLRKYKQPFRAIDIRVDGEQEDSWPHAFTRITITFEIEWEGEFDEGQVARALDEACNRYCPVDATLTRGTRIEVQRRDLG